MADEPGDAASDADADVDANDDDSTATDRPALPADPLLVWALGAFHAALLVVVGVLALHLAGHAGDLLQGLSTAVGFAAYLGLWASAWWTARGWLRDGGDPLAALRWGAANGLVVFAPAYLVVAAPVAFSGASVTFLVLALVVGALAAAAIGALVGGILGLVDHGLVRVGRLVAG